MLSGLAGDPTVATRQTLTNHLDMHAFTDIESSFAEKTPDSSTTKQSDAEINDRYIKGEGRILIETNRERLSVFVESLKKPGYIELAPFYQRRERWTNDRKSSLIESFIMNIPVPPVFLYEKEFNQYEVMDGQQRISALRDFYDDGFPLEKLEYWPELDGKKYSTLPDKIRAGIDRRSISSIVLLKESATDDKEVSLIRRVVFDRLNRGGIRLERQEIRNALFASPFNDLLHRLAALPKFKKAWRIPMDSDEASNSIFYQKMGDMEVVLRFFALRHAEKIEGPLQQFLDDYMFTMQKATTTDIDVLEKHFEAVLELGDEVFKEKLFRVWDADVMKWSTLPNKGFSDCVLTGLAWNLDKAATLIDKREAVMEATKQLFESHEAGTFTGRKSTKQDLLDRLTLFRSMLESIQ
ncbi:MAG: DUF262 domain-containing protein [Hydrogenophaga sp.]|uniref:DUF262 domain-containing protein n=1 Tax=Hydrogenophaga sp. TaxID=1904254 RepID=UPI0025C6492D|nr:DUF262 domain-containing protein [Hydrogenophaga sp.]MCG2655774.1 DUF262 domain-containing protein [Hydrogenophaga sp.]